MELLNVQKKKNKQTNKQTNKNKNKTKTGHMAWDRAHQK
jgi:hypothetical protein